MDISKTGKAILTMVEDEDVLQEIELYLLEHPEMRSRSYIERIVKANMYRSKRYSYSWGNRFKHVSLSPSDDIYWVMPFSENEISEHFTYSIEGDLGIDIAMSEIFDKLTEYETYLVWLYYVGGYNHREIADILGCSRTSITKRIGAIIRKLRRIYNVSGDIDNNAGRFGE